MRRWIIGYRFSNGQSDYSTPYKELPEFDCADVMPVAKLRAQLEKEFPQAEWMVVPQVGQPQPFTF